MDPTIAFLVLLLFIALSFALLARPDPPPRKPDAIYHEFRSDKK